jgi:hypothetical protein
MRTALRSGSKRKRTAHSARAKLNPRKSSNNRNRSTRSNRKKGRNRGRRKYRSKGKAKNRRKGTKSQKKQKSYVSLKNRRKGKSREGDRKQFMLPIRLNKQMPTRKTVERYTCDFLFLFYPQSMSYLLQATRQLFYLILALLPLLHQFGYCFEGSFVLPKRVGQLSFSLFDAFS